MDIVDLVGRLKQAGLVEDGGPASFYQKRFATTQLAVAAVLNVSLRLDIEGPLDSPALVRAASALVARHQALLPLPVILEELQIAQRPGAADFPLVFFALHPRDGQHLDLPGLQVTVADFAIPAARLDFGVLVVPTERGLKMWAECASYLGTENVRGWLEQYVELLAKFARSPESVARDW